MKRTQIEVNGMEFTKVEMTAEEYEQEFGDRRDTDNIIWLEDESEVPSDMIIEEFDGMYSVFYSGRGYFGCYSNLDEALELVSNYM